MDSEFLAKSLPADLKTGQLFLHLFFSGEQKFKLRGIPTANENLLVLGRHDPPHRAANTNGGLGQPALPSS
jgi:hypothetical protein